MSDRMAVMREGRLEQVGLPEELYERPKTPFVARFLGTSNLIEGTAREAHAIDTPLGPLSVEAELIPGRDYLLSIRPEKLRLSRAPAASGELGGGGWIGRRRAPREGSFACWSRSGRGRSGSSPS